MRFKTWPVAAVGLAGLLLLVVFSVVDRVATGAGDLHAARSAEHAPSRSRDASCGAARPTFTCRASSSATICSTPSRERAPEYRQRLAQFRETQSRRRWRSCSRSRERRGEDDSRILQPRSQPRRLLGGLRAALRLDHRREDQLQRQLPAPRSAAAPRGRARTSRQEIEELNNANLAAQRAEVDAAAGGVPQRALHACCGAACSSACCSPCPSVIRLRVLERRSEEQKERAQEAERPDARAVAAAGRGAGRRAAEAVARAARSRRPDAHGAADGARPHRSRRAPATDTRVAVGGRRMPSARGRHGAHSSATSRSACGRACSTTSACSRRSNGWRATSRAARNVPVELHDHRRPRRAHRPASHLHLSRRAGSADQLRAPRARGRISVDVRARDDALDVSVSDDGVGLDPQRRAAGFGLRGIEERVRELGGTITLESAAGQGATLAIWLPLATMERPLARAAG